MSEKILILDISWTIYRKSRKGQRKKAAWLLFDNVSQNGEQAEDALRLYICKYPQYVFRLVAEPTLAKKRLGRDAERRA